MEVSFRVEVRWSRRDIRNGEINNKRFVKFGQSTSSKKSTVGHFRVKLMLLLLSLDRVTVYRTLKIASRELIPAACEERGI
jgi:hypothetical protein